MAGCGTVWVSMCCSPWPFAEGAVKCGPYVAAASRLIRVQRPHGAPGRGLANQSQIQKRGSNGMYSGSNTCFAPSTSGDWVQNTSQITIVGCTASLKSRLLALFSHEVVISSTLRCAGWKTTSQITICWRCFPCKGVISSTFYRAGCKTRLKLRLLALL